ncbi:uncharacterized protein Dana_GF16073 [Drosophila ananassae]|uniref:Uncharacterized protein n=1 Tax=Drosophila ananassae TaxID=7217 RepID=B3M160_DROAN|nr:uncharacterized protein LOC6498870 isoform X2 [Drosophila ananassae]XP_044569953.1 uncharacterized protein LOC6498870 isoform X2 [Drosophila ananassae]EDV44330.1 uncharacterized protein Dana_GF16073 [Drosophila ananassae]
MDAHSTIVDLEDVELGLDWCVDSVGDRDGHVRAKLRQLQDNHVWIRQQLSHLQRRLVTRELEKQRNAYAAKDRLQGLLRQLELKHGRSWSL